MENGYSNLRCDNERQSLSLLVCCMFQLYLFIFPLINPKIISVSHVPIISFWMLIFMMVEPIVMTGIHQWVACRKVWLGIVTLFYLLIMVMGTYQLHWTLLLPLLVLALRLFVPQKLVVWWGRIFADFED